MPCIPVSLMCRPITSIPFLSCTFDAHVTNFPLTLKVSVFVTERLREEHMEEMTQFEPQKMITALVEQMFQEGDTNKDGSIDAEEMESIERQLKEQSDGEDDDGDDGDHEDDVAEDEDDVAEEKSDKDEL